MGWQHLHPRKIPGQSSSARLVHFPGRGTPSDRTHACKRMGCLRHQLDAVWGRCMRGRNLRKPYAICILRSEDISCGIFSREKNNGRPGWVVGGIKVQNAFRNNFRTVAPFWDFFSGFLRSRQAQRDARIAAPRVITVEKSAVDKFLPAKKVSTMWRLTRL